MVRQNEVSCSFTLCVSLITELVCLSFGVLPASGTTPSLVNYALFALLRTPVLSVFLRLALSGAQAKGHFTTAAAACLAGLGLVVHCLSLG